MGLSIHANEDLLQKARICMRDSMSGYTKDYIGALIRRKEVPSDFVDRILDNVVKYPEIAGISKEIFLEALALERPDCDPLLRTKEGDAWFEEVCKHLVLGLPMKLVGAILGR